MFSRTKTKSRNHSSVSDTIITRPYIHHPHIFLFVFLSLVANLFAQSDDSTSTGSTSVSAAVHAQQDSKKPPVIGAIVVMGNKVTEKEIIIREMTLAVGDTIVEDEIEYSKTRIYSLGLFNKVDIEYPPIDTTVLIVTVNERWFVYPVPMLGIVDRDLSKWFYGLGVVHNNFRGRNEKLFAGFVLGYNPWVKCEYSNPWLIEKDNIFSTTTFSYSHVENKSLLSQGTGPNFFESHYGASQLIGKRFNQFDRAWITVGFSYVEVSDKLAGRTISNAGIDRYVYSSIGFNRDTRDLKEYATRGTFVTLGYTKEGFRNGVDYNSIAIDARKYIPTFFNVSIAIRSFSAIAFGPSIPNYNHVFFGYGERIRGHFKQEYEGENIFGASAELRIPIIPQLYIHISDIPIPQFATGRFGLYAALFADVGAIWNRHDNVSWNNQPFGYGGGLHFLLPYGFVGRVEYAFNELGQGEIVFDVSASF